MLESIRHQCGTARYDSSRSAPLAVRLEWARVVAEHIPFKTDNPTADELNELSLEERRRVCAERRVRNQDSLDLLWEVTGADWCKVVNRQVVALGNGDAPTTFQVALEAQQNGGVFPLVFDKNNQNVGE